MSIARYDLTEDCTTGKVDITTVPETMEGRYVSYEDCAALEAKCAALAAENAALKQFCKDAAFDADYEAELGMERGGFTDALNDIKTPATDDFLAEVRAISLEDFADVMAESGNYDAANHATKHAHKIRQEAQ